MQALAYPDTVAALVERLRRRLGDVVPDLELRYKAEIACEINRIKREKRAIILGHNYMEPVLYHSVPDYTGDSLELSRVAARSDADRIVFCGVRFMAETAKILNPGRTVLLPSARGGCSLAAGITADDVRDLKARYPGVPVVTYVNTYAEVKAESDFACTSANAAAVVRHLLAQGHRRVLFLPDEFLARNVAREVGAAVVVHGPGGTADGPAGGAEGARPLLIGWKGRCEVHEKFTEEDIVRIRRQFDDVVVLAHPECRPEVVEAADFSGGTADMIRYIERVPRGRFLLLTECSMGDNVASSNPDREMLRLCSVRCPHMNEITLEETLDALRLERYRIEVPELVRLRARTALDRMIAIGASGRS